MICSRKRLLRNASETTRIQTGKELVSEEKVKIRTNGYKATMYLMPFTPAVILINKGEVE